MAKAQVETSLWMRIGIFLLAAICLIVVIMFGMKLIRLLMPPDDPDTNSLQNLVAEIQQGVFIMQTSKLDHYLIDFPFSLQQTEKINKDIAAKMVNKPIELCLRVNNREGNTIVPFTKCKELPKSVTKIQFNSYPNPYNNLDSLPSVLVHPMPVLLPYRLRIEKVGEGYEVFIRGLDLTIMENPRNPGNTPSEPIEPMDGYIFMI